MAVNKKLNEFVIPYLDIRDRVKGYAVSIVKGGLDAIGRSAGGVRPPLQNLATAGPAPDLKAPHRHTSPEPHRLLTAGPPASSHLPRRNTPMTLTGHSLIAGRPVAGERQDHLRLQPGHQRSSSSPPTR